MSYVNYSIHWPDPQLLERIKAEAARQNISPGAFVRAASEKALAECKKIGKKRIGSVTEKKR
jgi:hypothetical protein